MSLSIPTTYADRYEIRRPLGTGAFSRTYVAYDTMLRREVALKVLRREHQANDEFSARFDREAQAAAVVSHPNVVPVFDFGREDGLPFIVMQYVEGKTLREFDRDDGPLTIEEVISIGRQVLDGLSAIHDQGIIHRDIKPQNVLLDNRMVARLTDFGVAFLANDLTLTETGATIGTAAYMSPEQATGSNVGPGADLYSVGVMLYELLTRRLPFRGDNPVQVLYRHVSDLPPRPRDLNPQIPIELEAVILRALAKMPSERYPDARAMRDALTNQPGKRPAPESLATVRSEPERFTTPEPAPTPPRQPTSHSSRQRTTPIRTRRRKRQRSGWALPVLFAVVLMVAVAVAFALQGIGGNGGSGDDPGGLALTPTEVGVPGGAFVDTETATPDPTATTAPTATPTGTPTGTPTATPEPPEPTATPEPPATNTPEPPEPEPTPEPTEPPSQGGAAPAVEFDVPVAIATVPPAWQQGSSVTFGRDDFVAGGAYRREDGVLYDRPAAHLYAQNTDYPRTTVNFQVQGQPDLPDSFLAIVIIGMDDEFPAKVPCRIALNGQTVWEGESPFGNETWTRIGWQLGSLDVLQPGRNRLTIEVLVDDGEFGLPPWILLTEAQVYWD